ncbi:hypothetical protein [Vagococcus sp.]|uniref:hypothetical protein n=1 Tax=Vagococcus sp. TaxID=1933889 RepID=UPI003F9BAA15
MAEAIVISGFLLLLLILQIKEQKNLIVTARVSWVKRLLALLLSVAIFIVFWQPELHNQIKLACFSILLLSIGFLKEGLAQDHLIRLGVLSGEYQYYESIQIESLPNNQVIVNFYKRKNNRFSMVFPLTVAEMTVYFEKLGLIEKVVIGELEENLPVIYPLKR